MRTDDKTKMKVIIFIDKIKPKLENTLYHKELIDLRKKYIYKDISQEELKRDVTYLKTIKRIIL
jgi:hypothetical protein